MKVITKNEKSVLSVKADFNEVLDNNFAAICAAIANKGMIIKELITLFERERGGFDAIIQIMMASKGEKAAKVNLSEKLGIKPQTAQCLLDMSIEDLASLNAKKLRETLDDYKAKIEKLIVQ